MKNRAYLGQGLLHDLRTVVHSQNDIRDSCTSQSLNLMQDHGLIAKFHQWLGESEGLVGLSAAGDTMRTI